ncbi:YggU family protein [bacterium]|nr:YggU family protein [bacterium]
MIKETSDGLLIRIKIVPNSSKNDLIIEDEFIKVKVTAQPIENKANKALVEFLSKRFKVPKTSIEIVKGDTSKEKTLLFSIKDEEKKQNIISELTK